MQNNQTINFHPSSVVRQVGFSHLFFQSVLLFSCSCRCFGIDPELK